MDSLKETSMTQTNNQQYKLMLGPYSAPKSRQLENSCLTTIGFSVGILVGFFVEVTVGYIEGLFEGNFNGTKHLQAIQNNVGPMCCTKM
jgi:hypothetical protein